MDFLSLATGQALADRATVAEMAEAAMTEKRLNSWRCPSTIQFACLFRPWNKLTAKGHHTEIHFRVC